MDSSIKKIIDSIDNKSGRMFFESIVRSLAFELSMDHLFIAKLNPISNTSKSIALYSKGTLNNNFEYKLYGTPCAIVIDDSICCYPQHVTNHFPEDQLLIDLKIQGYLGTALYNSNNEVIGLIVALSESIIKNIDYITSIFKLFSGRISVELDRSEQEHQIQLLSETFQHAAEAIMITDKDKRILKVNPAFESLFGYTSRYITGKSPSILTPENTDKKFHLNMWKSIALSGKWSGEITNIKSDGDFITMWASITEIKNNENNIENYMAIYSDITKIKETQSKLNYLAYNDPLTSLHNKSYLTKILETKKTRSVILLDINNFNYINSAYGFNFGDEILSSIASKLKQFNADYEFNIHADEFALLFNKSVDIYKTINQIKDYFIDHPVNINDINIYISFTFGAAVSNCDLLRKSSLALKNAKETGKNHHVLFDKNSDNIFLNRKTIIETTNLLHKIIENDEIVPYFQGIRNNHSGKINKFESLMRIHHDNKVLSPCPFIEAAKFSGLLPKITKIMIDKSFKAMSNRTDSFSINITEADLNNYYLEDYIEEKCKLYDINPNRIILEILEGVSAHGKKNHVTQLHNLKKFGLSIAIDDFGTEYSNFERLLEHDIDYIKIDSRYIKDIDTNPKSLQITMAIVYFAKIAGISCIAEFVHNESVQEVVQNLGVDFSQGYLFSEPHRLS